MQEDLTSTCRCTGQQCRTRWFPGRHIIVLTGRDLHRGPQQRDHPSIHQAENPVDALDRARAPRGPARPPRARNSPWFSEPGGPTPPHRLPQHRQDTQGQPAPPPPTRGSARQHVQPGPVGNNFSHQGPATAPCRTPPQHGPPTGPPAEFPTRAAGASHGRRESQAVLGQTGTRPSSQDYEAELQRFQGINTTQF